MSIKFLKNDAIVKIEVGSGFVQRIQQILMFVLKDIPQEKIEEYRQLTLDKKELTELWMEHVTTLSVLLKEIEEKADSQGLSYEMNPEDASSLPDFSSNQEEN